MNESNRAFKTGQYVITADGLTGCIYEDNGDTYQIALCERDEERSVSPSAVTLWTPKPGDGVTARNCEDGEAGQFLHDYEDDMCVVKWSSFPLPEIRRRTQLEPVWR